MANYYGYARSSAVTFNPKKVALLMQVFPSMLELGAKDRATGKQALYAVTDDGTPTTAVYPDNLNALIALGYPVQPGYFDLGLLDVIHLALEPIPDNAIIWTEIGHEKLLYLSGFATKIDHTGAVLKQINLEDINK